MANIIASHAIARGSIPRVGIIFCSIRGLSHSLFCHLKHIFLSTLQNLLGAFLLTLSSISAILHNLNKLVFILRRVDTNIYINNQYSSLSPVQCNLSSLPQLLHQWLILCILNYRYNTKRHQTLNSTLIITTASRLRTVQES